MKSVTLLLLLVPVFFQNGRAECFYANSGQQKEKIFLSSILFMKSGTNDSITVVEKRKILGNTFSFVKYNEGFRTILKIFLLNGKDSLIVFEREDSYRYGDCNSTSTMASDYKVEGDKLLIWSYEMDDEHMDDRHHHFSSSTKKETYAIQKKGAIVRLKTEYGKKDPELNEFIRQMLEAKLTEQDNR